MVEAVMSELVSMRAVSLFCGKIQGNSSISAGRRPVIRRVPSVNSMAYQQISLSVKTGKTFRAIRE
jgi:hypothetical protein